MADRRDERVWKFFHPEPTEPVRLEPPPMPSRSLPVLKLVAGTVLGAAGFWLSLPALALDPQSVGIGLAITLAGVTALTHYGLRRRLALDRLKMRATRFSRPQVDGRLWRPQTFWEKSFAYVVRGAFNRAAPVDKEERESWKRETAGFELNLTKELVETYEDLVDRRPSKVRWLADWHAKQLAEQRAAYSEEFPDEPLVHWRVHLGIAVGALLTVAGAVLCWRTLWQQGGLLEYALVPALIAFGVRVGCDQGCELRRGSNARAETLTMIEQRYSDEHRAYREWCHVLSDRPSDIEIARWLDYDKRFLRAKAMELYQVNNADVISHLALTGPAPDSWKFREPGGPNRYTKYLVQIFLLTAGGIRLCEFHLYAETGEWEEIERRSFRYESVASVHVDSRQMVKRNGARSTGIQSIFTIALVNSQSIEVPLDTITGFDDPGQFDLDQFDPDRFDAGQYDPDQSDPGQFGAGREGQPTAEGSDELLARALDSSGVSGALRMMEAITADGKDWLESRHIRQRRRLAQAGWESGDLIGDAPIT